MTTITIREIAAVGFTLVRDMVVQPICPQICPAAPHQRALLPKSWAAASPCLLQCSKYPNALAFLAGHN
jgi:hypothetical protein